MQEQVSEQDDMSQFINKIIDAKNLPGLNEKVRAQLVTDLTNRLMDQIDRSIINSMSSEKIDEFNDLIDKENVSESEIREFIENSGVDIKKTTVHTMLLFRDLYLEDSNARDQRRANNESH